MSERLSESNYHTICDQLAASDPQLASVIKAFGYPPLWTRPNTFETLVHIILEQQVSLASALAALIKLREYIGEIIPEKVLLLSDEEFKACYFSRQKTSYTRYLANALLSGEISLTELEELDDDDVRSRLTSLKGIGNWTVDIYLMFVLQRADTFPIGDLAAVNAFKKVKSSLPGITREEIVREAELWKPYRTAATMILWHWYLSQRKK
jgi:DNA-3-methyladenine glycosylase II